MFLVDFGPDTPPYEFLSVVELEPRERGRAGDDDY
jgi:hypothetical protein